MSYGAFSNDDYSLDEQAAEVEPVQVCAWCLLNGYYPLEMLQRQEEGRTVFVHIDCAEDFDTRTQPLPGRGIREEAE